MYKVTRNTTLDFAGQSYASLYPNLHPYPATMLPQIGIELLNELNIKKGAMLDPYCGSGSSFIAGLDRGLQDMYGYDINPLAVLISRTKFTKLNIEKVKSIKQKLRNYVYDLIKDEKNLRDIKTPDYSNIQYWFSMPTLQYLAALRQFIMNIPNKDIRRIFMLPLSETIRACSYVRQGEFKLYRIKSEDVRNFNPDVMGVYFSKLNSVIEKYERHYLPKLNGASVKIEYQKFKPKANNYDVVLTSPPYGDSRTTVAYGQFSQFANEWFGIKFARQVDRLLMGGAPVKTIYDSGVIAPYIKSVAKQSPKRALEVSSFYCDLERSIANVANSVKLGGISIYVVGNRRVKDVQLATDQFIAEKFEDNGFKHLFTYERMLGNKSMPLKNSPTNQPGKRASTITTEYVVVCQKKKKTLHH